MTRLVPRIASNPQIIIATYDRLNGAHSFTTGHDMRGRVIRPNCNAARAHHNGEDAGQRTSGGVQWRWRWLAAVYVRD